MKSTHLSRRDALGLLALGAMSQGAWGAEPKKLLLGCSQYGFHAHPLNDTIDGLAKIGFKSIEFAAPTGKTDWPFDPAKLDAERRRDLKKRLTDRGLTLASIMCNTVLQTDPETHIKNRLYLEKVAALGAEVSPQGTPVINSILGGMPGEWDKVKVMFRDRAGDWAKIGEKTKTIFCIKGHRFGAMNHPEQVRWLHDQVKSDWLKVCFDWSHFELREIKMAEAIKELIPVTKFVHVKDAIAVPGQADRPKFGIPGAGTTDYAKLLPALIAAGYRGSVMIEISGMLWAEKDYDPFALAKKGYECLAKVPGVF